MFAPPLNKSTTAGTLHRSKRDFFEVAASSIRRTWLVVAVELPSGGLTETAALN